MSRKLNVLNVLSEKTFATLFSGSIDFSFCSFAPCTLSFKEFGRLVFFRFVYFLSGLGFLSKPPRSRRKEGKGKGVLKGERETGGNGVRYPTRFVSDPRKRCLRCATPPHLPKASGFLADLWLLCFLLASSPLLPHVFTRPLPISVSCALHSSTSGFFIFSRSSCSGAASVFPPSWLFRRSARGGGVLRSGFGTAEGPV